MSAVSALLAALVAAGVEGGSTTLLDSRPYLRNGAVQETPIYESFALSAQGEGAGWLQDLRLVARGWGRLTLGPPIDDRAAADLDSLFVEGKLLQRRLTVRLGRQLAAGGALRATQLDGLSVRALVLRGFGSEAWVGAPVQPRFDVQPGGDFLAGGRLFWRHAFDSELGASIVYAVRHHELAREDVALDGSSSLFRTVQLSGRAQWSLAEERLAEARFAALWQPARWLQLGADAQRTAPDLFLDRDSIFAVISDERRDEAGGELVLRPDPALSITADGHWLRVEGGDGARASLLAAWRLPRGTTGVELRLLTQPDNGYKLARLFAIRRLPHSVTLTLDLDAYWLERQVNGGKRAVAATLTAGWAFAAAWEAMVAGSLGESPYFDRRAEIVARLAWRFGGRP